MVLHDQRLVEILPGHLGDLTGNGVGTAAHPPWADDGHGLVWIVICRFCSSLLIGGGYRGLLLTAASRQGDSQHCQSQQERQGFHGVFHLLHGVRSFFNLFALQCRSCIRIHFQNKKTFYYLKVSLTRSLPFKKCRNSLGACFPVAPTIHFSVRAII